jgi:hypothetical protein
MIESSTAKVMSTLESFEGNPNLIFQRCVELFGLYVC